MTMKLYPCDAGGNVAATACVRHSLPDRAIARAGNSLRLVRMYFLLKLVLSVICYKPISQGEHATEGRRITRRVTAVPLQRTATAPQATHLTRVPRSLPLLLLVPAQHLLLPPPRCQDMWFDCCVCTVLGGLIIASLSFSPFPFPLPSRFVLHLQRGHVARPPRCSRLSPLRG